jgi:hypothetical protein
MRHRKRKLVPNRPSVDIDRSPHGGHDFDQIDDHEDDDDYTYRCAGCGCVVSGWELDEGHWPARAGRCCMKLLMGAN